MPRLFASLSMLTLTLLLTVVIGPMQPTALRAQDPANATLTAEEWQAVAWSFDMDAEWFQMCIDRNHPGWEPLLAELRAAAADRGLLITIEDDWSDDILVGDEAARTLAARYLVQERRESELIDRYDALEATDPADEVALAELRAELDAVAQEYERLYAEYRAIERTWSDAYNFFGYQVTIQTPLFKRIDVVMDGTPLDDAVANLLVQSGVNFVLPLDPEMRNNSVTCRMRDTTIHGALSSILSVFDYEFDSDAESSTYRDGQISRTTDNYSDRAAFVDRIVKEMDIIEQLIWRCRKNW